MSLTLVPNSPFSRSMVPIPPEIQTAHVSLSSSESLCHCPSSMRMGFFAEAGPLQVFVSNHVSGITGASRFEGVYQGEGFIIEPKDARGQRLADVVECEELLGASQR
eukprot:scaffold285397_cov18-Tisochrysis_lutea.AAC.3